MGGWQRAGEQGLVRVDHIMSGVGPFPAWAVSAAVLAGAVALIERWNSSVGWLASITALAAILLGNPGRTTEMIRFVQEIGKQA